MTCKFCNHSGQQATIQLPGFDGQKIRTTIEVCPEDARILKEVIH